MKLKQFFEKYNKQIVLVLFFLLVIKSFQSCNRKNEVQTVTNKMEGVKDSLDSRLSAMHDTIVNLRYDLKLANFSVESAEKRAEAIQSTAEKTTRNTTIQIK